MKAQSNIKIGERAPKIHIDKWLLNKPKNKTIENRFIVLDFWATWCAPCLRNVDHINTLKEHFSDQDILFLQMTKESAQTARSVFDRVEFQTPVVTDKRNKTYANFGDGINEIAYYPMVVLIDDTNIIRWYGSSEKLTIEMLEELLLRKNIPIAQMSLNGPYNIARDPETYINREFGVELWSELMQDPNIVFTSLIQEIPKNQEKIFDVKTATGALIQGHTLNSMLKSLYPDKVFVIPESLISTKYNFYFVNHDLNSDSDQLLLHEIASQLDLDLNKSKTNHVERGLFVKDDALLIPSTSDKRSPISLDENDILTLSYNTISELASAISQRTDLFLTTTNNTKKRYQFNVNIATNESIKESLKCYGIFIRDTDIISEVYVFSEKR